MIQGNWSQRDLVISSPKWEPQYNRCHEADMLKGHWHENGFSIFVPMSLQHVRFMASVVLCLPTSDSKLPDLSEIDSPVSYIPSLATKPYLHTFTVGYHVAFYGANLRHQLIFLTSPAAKLQNRDWTYQTWLVLAPISLCFQHFSNRWWL